MRGTVEKTWELLGHTNCPLNYIISEPVCHTMSFWVYKCKILGVFFIPCFVVLLKLELLLSRRKGFISKFWWIIEEKCLMLYHNNMTFTTKNMRQLFKITNMTTSLLNEVLFSCNFRPFLKWISTWKSSIIQQYLRENTILNQSNIKLCF